MILYHDCWSFPSIRQKVSSFLDFDNPLYLAPLGSVLGDLPCLAYPHQRLPEEHPHDSESTWLKKKKSQPHSSRTLTLWHRETCIAELPVDPPAPLSLLFHFPSSSECRGVRGGKKGRSAGRGRRKTLPFQRKIPLQAFQRFSLLSLSFPLSNAHALSHTHRRNKSQSQTQSIQRNTHWLLLYSK